MRATLMVDERDTPLSPKEAKMLMRCLGDYRKGVRTRTSKREEFDLEVYGFKQLGYSDAEIGRTMGCTARSVRGALQRVDAGRYGDARLLG